MIDGNYALAGALTGFVVGLTGVGGGALMTPILLLVFGVSPTTAIATDLWFAAITKVVAARIHSGAGQVDWVVVRRLWLGSLPTALAVVVLVSLGAKVQKVAWLTQAIGVVILITAIGLLFAPKLLQIARERRIGNPEEFKSRQPALTVAAGAVLGICVALTSVGAGALGSVMLLYLYPLRMKPHRLVATDIVHAIPLAVVAGLGYLFAGMVNWQMLLSLLAGSIPAVIAGSLLAKRFAGRSIQIALSLVLLLAGGKMFA
jgi:uncharacterized membrane protein YfcA